MIRTIKQLETHLERGGEIAIMAPMVPSDGFRTCDPVTGEGVHGQALKIARKRDILTAVGWDITGAPYRWARSQ